MATHSSILAWEIPWTEEPNGPRSMESESRQDSVTQQQLSGRTVASDFRGHAGRGRLWSV